VTSAAEEEEEEFNFDLEFDRQNSGKSCSFLIRVSVLLGIECVTVI